MSIEEGFSLNGNYKSFQARELTKACNSIKRKGKGTTEKLVTKILANNLTHDVKNPVLLKKVLKELQVKQQ